MKTIKYIVSAIILLISINALAQSPTTDVSLGINTYVRDFKYDPSELIGPWTARNGDITYELSFIIDTITVGKRTLRNLNGTMVYKRNGNIERTISPQSHPLYMSIFGGPVSSTYLGIIFCDYARDVKGEVVFKLVEGNSNKATWRLRKISGDGTFDLPREMTFTRVVTYTGGRTSEEFTGGTVTIKP